MQPKTLTTSTQPLPGASDHNLAAQAAAADPVTARVSMGMLTIQSGDGSDSLKVSRDVSGKLFVNDGQVAVSGPSPTAAGTSKIVIRSQGGNDVIRLDESLGLLPAANIFGGDGNDNITGGSNADFLFGESGNDVLQGGGGDDRLLGGDGDDLLIGGDGSDQLMGGAGNDVMVWGPGDDSDLMDGGEDFDTAHINTGSSAETLVLKANGEHLRLDRVDVSPFTLDIRGTEKISLHLNAGDDSFNASGQLNGLIALTVDGGSGNDVLIGSNGVDTLFGGDGNDTLQGGLGDDKLLGGDGNDVLTGGDGNDQMIGGAGSDLMIWAPGDDSDLMDGGGDFDTAQVTTGNSAETVVLKANGEHLRLDRVDVTPFTLDIRATEKIVLNLGGGNDSFDASGTPNVLSSLNVDGGAGDDVLIGSSGIDILKGGDGNDALQGGLGVDLLLGGNGDDVLTGGDGNDLMEGGAGNDLMIWNPGDDSDLMDGGSDIDTARVTTSSLAETIVLKASGEHLRLDRVDVSPFMLDIRATENIVLNLGDGNDSFNASGTPNALSSLTVDGGAGDDVLIGSGGFDMLVGGDGNDTLQGGEGNDLLKGGNGDDVLLGGDGYDLIYGGAGNDRLIWGPGDDGDLLDGGSDIDTAQITTSAVAETVVLQANGEQLRMEGVDASPFILDIRATEKIVLNLGAGSDSFSVSGKLNGLASLTVDAGSGDDILIGSSGADTLIGGDGDDTIDGRKGDDTVQLGAGNDVFLWSSGDGSDRVEGGTGFDALVFNGSFSNDVIELSAANGWLELLRHNDGSVVEANSVEGMKVTAGFGGDLITLHSLEGTGLQQLELSLAGAIGDTAGDRNNDTVVLAGGSGDEHITLRTQSRGEFVVEGMGAATKLTQVEAADQLVLQGGDGNDQLQTVGVQAGQAKLSLDGGAGNDLLLGGSSSESFRGGSGNDTVRMGGGDDSFAWIIGDGSDLVDGEAGIDTARVEGDGSGEIFSIGVGAGGALVSHGNTATTLKNVEVLHISAAGGADQITLSSMAGSGVGEVVIDLGINGVGDGVEDRIVLQGSASGDQIELRQRGDTLEIFGLGARIVIDHFDAGRDSLTILGLDGDDLLNAQGLGAQGPRLTLNGGAGSDVLIGGEGGDVLLGHDGDDLLIGGAGDDVLMGQAGQDLLDGGLGNDLELQA